MESGRPKRPTDHHTRAYFVRRLAAHEDRSKCCRGVHTAPKPIMDIEGGCNWLGFASEVAADKHINHLPLDRHCRMMARAGLVVDHADAVGSASKASRDTSSRGTQRCTTASSTETSSAAEETWWRMTDRERASRRCSAWPLLVADAVCGTAELLGC
jgi:hypothetical protein